MTNEIEWLKLVWLVIVAGVANMTPPLAMKVWPKWNAPISVQYLGSHKTWRGLITGIIMAQIVYLIIPRYIENMSWYFGGMLGAAALIGDAVKSFFKRRVGVKSGKSWFPWDQIDWIIGLTIVSFGILNWIEVIVLLVAGLLLHLLVKAIGYWMKVNESVI